MNDPPSALIPVELLVRVIRFEDKVEADWDVVRARLLAIRDGECLSFDVNDIYFLFVLHIAELGYLVTGSSDGETDYYTLIERVLGDEPVSAFDGGDTHIYPRYAFVTKLLMLKVTETYFFTAERDNSCEWVCADEAMYE